MMRDTPLTRRALLLYGAAGLGLAACGAKVAADAPRSQGSAAATTPPPTLPPVAPYALLPGEVEPAAKEAAVRFLEAALTVSADAGQAPQATATLDPAVAKPLADKLPSSGPSAVEIIYPQYGGLTTARDLACVMVTAEQLTLGSGEGASSTGVQTRPFTVDVRLSSKAGAWTVTEVIVPQPTAAAPSLSAAARAVLDDDRILLPGDARKDVLSGRVDDRVLAGLTRLAERWTLDVHVFFSGHPTNVFATDRVSKHTLGLAVDIWALDGVPVIDQARSPWRDVMLAATDAGATEVGGPEDIGSRPFFSDQVHQDHLHLGFGAD